MDEKHQEFPHLQTLDEFVAFFEEHDLSPYLDQMEEVEFEIDLKGETRSSRHGTCAEIGQDCQISGEVHARFN